MIKLTSVGRAHALSDKIPIVAVERMVAFEGADGMYHPDELWVNERY